MTVKSLFNSCCMNWKVIAGLAVVGLGVWVFEPGLMRAVLPLLVVAICPLSMLFMMRGMMGGQGAQQDQQMSQPGVMGVYTCPMHPEVRSPRPGRCPTCGMRLVATVPPAPRTTTTGGALTREEQLARLQAQLASVQATSDAIAKEIAQLEAARVPVVREAESVARAADAHVRERM
jgi:Heavy metal binding domain/Protein of unknown function (DUF2933)